MTDLQKKLKAAAKPAFICHGRAGENATFKYLATAQQWCLLRQGYIKQRVGHGQYQIVFDARNR